MPSGWNASKRRSGLEHADRVFAVEEEVMDFTNGKIWLGEKEKEIPSLFDGYAEAKEMDNVELLTSVLRRSIPRIQHPLDSVGSHCAFLRKPFIEEDLLKSTLHFSHFRGMNSLAGTGLVVVTKRLLHRWVLEGLCPTTTNRRMGATVSTFWIRSTNAPRQPDGSSLIGHALDPDRLHPGV